MLHFLRKIIPHFILKWYHWSLAHLGAIRYGHPSRQLIVIGVTGTKGKSTTVNLIGHLLREAGFKVGVISTVLFRIADREWSNDLKQTMPGRFRLQEMLRQMVDAGCRYAVIETSSEGIAQYRHQGIDYDIAVFTNLSPEHIESHGSYERYREAKLRLFTGLSGSARKTVGGEQIKKVIIVNGEDTEAHRFLAPAADETWAYGLRPLVVAANHQLIGSIVASDASGSRFTADGQAMEITLLGTFNVANSLAAIAVVRSQGIGINTVARALQSFKGIPGRLQEIPNARGFKVFVDYAHEPASLEAVYQTIKSFGPKKFIAVLGSQGGGRDKRKRPLLGRLAGQYADHVIVTNEDPYDEDPRQIIEAVAAGARGAGRTTVETITDRREAIRRAVAVAQAGDIVLITGKGGETRMAVAGGKLVPWSDETVVAETVRQATQP